MKFQRFNWQIWAGFLLSVVAALSYPLVFVNFPVTRDFPWANLLLFAIAAALLFIGVRRAFAPDRSRKSKIAGSILATLGVLILGLFIFSAFILSRWLPASYGAPHVGQKAPDFSLTDSNGRLVSLSDLLSAPIQSVAPAVAGGASPQNADSRPNEAAALKPKGVLLIFYRGYW